MSNYYCLITGLPKLSLSDNKLAMGTEEFREECLGELTKRDKQIVDLFYLAYDNANLLKLLRSEDADIDSRGCLDKQELLNNISYIKENKVRATKTFPSYMEEFVLWYESEESKDRKIMPEDYLSSLYYNFATKSKNKFVASWFGFNRLLSNIILAVTARRFKVPYSDFIVGDDWISQQIRTSTSRDFGLSTDIDNLDEMMKLAEEKDLIEREKAIDKYRWEYLEEEAFFHHFSIERLFVFILQTSMIERWVELDKEKGKEMLRGLVETLKEDVSIPEEFKK